MPQQKSKPARSTKFGGLLIQPRIPGISRIARHASFTPALNEAILAEMDRWGVSGAFVLATCASYALGVEDQPDYRKVRQERQAVLGKKAKAGKRGRVVKFKGRIAS